MKRAKFLKIPPCTLSDVKSEKEVIAKSRILEVGGEKAAEISLYYKNQLKARYFADEENHYAWINDKWTTCRLDNVARMCKNLPVEKEAYYWSNKEFIWNTKEDKQRVTDFLDSCDVDDYETNLSEIKRARANKRKSERIEKEMSDVPCVTEDMERWLDEKVFPGHILFSKREGKGTAYICTACKRSGSVKEKWKHKEIVHCPKCNQVASVNNRQKQKVEHVPVVILQKCNNRWVERQFKAVCRWSKEGKVIELFEQCRAIIPMGKTYGKVYYGTINNADEFEQDFWDKNPAGKRFSPSYLYPGNLKEVLPCGNLERSGMDILADKGKKFYVNRYIMCFHARRYWEYLVKSGLYELVTEEAFAEAFAEAYTCKEPGRFASIFKEELEKVLDVSLEKKATSDIMVSGARITDIFSKEADEFAEMYYKEIRSFSTDAKKIAENLNKKESDIRKIKSYLFEDKSLLDTDTGEWRRFDPDCAIAQSWQRLMIGKDIKPHDKTLIEHELLEMKIKKENPNMEHWKAHEIASEKYDYPKEATEYYGNLEKHKKNK